MQWIETLNENTFSLPRLSLRMRKMDISIDTYPDLRHLYAHFCSGAQFSVAARFTSTSGICSSANKQQQQREMFYCTWNYCGIH